MVKSIGVNGFDQLDPQVEAFEKIAFLGEIDVFGFETLEGVIKWLEKRAVHSPGEEAAVPVAR